MQVCLVCLIFGRVGTSLKHNNLSIKTLYARGVSSLHKFKQTRHTLHIELHEFPEKRL